MAVSLLGSSEVTDAADDDFRLSGFLCTAEMRCKEIRGLVSVKLAARQLSVQPCSTPDVKCFLRVCDPPLTRPSFPGQSVRGINFLTRPPVKRHDRLEDG